MGRCGVSLHPARSQAKTRPRCLGRVFFLAKVCKLYVVLDLNALTGEFVQRMQQHYGDRLARVVLYGSYARGDFHAESDVDLLVVLRDEELNGWAESKATFKLEYELSD